MVRVRQTRSGCRRRDGHAGRGRLPHQGDLGGGEGGGLVDEVAEGALQFQGFGGEGADGLDGVRVFPAQRLKAGGGLVSIVGTLLIYCFSAR